MSGKSKARRTREGSEARKYIDRHIELTGDFARGSSEGNSHRAQGGTVARMVIGSRGYRTSPKPVRGRETP